MKFHIGAQEWDEKIDLGLCKMIKMVSFNKKGEMESMLLQKTSRF